MLRRALAVEHHLFRRFAELEHNDAVHQIRAWMRAGATEVQIVVATRMGVESIRRAIGGIVGKPRQ